MATDSSMVDVASLGIRATITRGLDGVPVVFVDTTTPAVQENAAGPLLRIRLNDCPVWANPPGPGDPLLLRELTDDLALPHATERIAALEAELARVTEGTTPIATVSNALSDLSHRLAYDEVALEEIAAIAREYGFSV